MTSTHTAVALYRTDAEATESIRALQQVGFALQGVSIVSKDCQTVESVVTYYETTGHLQARGSLSVCWGGLQETGFFVMSRLGVLVVGGPLVLAIIHELEQDNDSLSTDLSLLGRGLLSFGIPKRNIVVYEKALRDHNALLVASGAMPDATTAHAKLQQTGAIDVALHHGAQPPPCAPW